MTHADIDEIAKSGALAEINRQLHWRLEKAHELTEWSCPPHLDIVRGLLLDALLLLEALEKRTPSKPTLVPIVGEVKAIDPLVPNPAFTRKIMY